MKLATIVSWEVIPDPQEFETITTGGVVEYVKLPNEGTLTVQIRGSTRVLKVMQAELDKRINLDFDPDAIP